MSIKLRELIRQVRACKTAAEERAVIAKESAAIRTAFKEDDTSYRYRNIAKLLFIHMLGYPSHYGQIECLKLIAANNYHEKRIGYLGLMLLLTDQEEILTLVINSLKNDLNHSNPYIIGLSLTAIGNLASPDMARDVSTDIIKQMKCDNIYIKKKTCLALIRIFQQLPELIEDAIEPIVHLLTSQSSGHSAIGNHAVCLTLYQLIISILNLDYETYISHFIPHASLIIKQLKYLLSVGFLPEYDVNGITDPFLQILCLKLLRFMGRNNEDVSNQIQDILAQIATNTESNKNIGNAILYECVLTIMEIQSEQSLKVLAINILGRFLLNRDNNIRYVALNTLLKIIHTDISTVQRHRTIIIECLKDSDASIRQRALELIYELINETNIEVLVCELLNYLVIATNEQKMILCSKISDAVDRYSPSIRWHIDTKITMLSIINNTTMISEDIITSLIALIQQNASELASYVVYKLFYAIQSNVRQISLLYIAIWCIGEYGEYLLAPPPASMLESVPSTERVTPAAIIQLFESTLKITPTIQHSIQSASVVTVSNAEMIKNYALVAMLKLSTKFSEGNELSKLCSMIEQYKNHIYLETQQRSVEFSVLLNENYSKIKLEVCKKMPVITQDLVQSKRTRRANSSDANEILSPTSKKSLNSPSSKANTTSNDLLSPKGATASVPALTKSVGGGAPNLLDLDDIFGGGSSSSANATSNGQLPLSPSPATAPVSNAADLLADIFTAPTSTKQQPPVVMSSSGAPTSSNANPMNDIMGLFDGKSLAPASGNQPTSMNVFSPKSNTSTIPTSASPSAQSFTAYEKDGLALVFDLSKPNVSDLSFSQIKVYFSNNSTSNITDLLFQAAFPKYITLQMDPATGTTINAGSKNQVSQNVKIQNTLHHEKKPIMMKIKLMYTKDGRKVEEMATVNNFPANF